MVDPRIGQGGDGRTDAQHPNPHGETTRMADDARKPRRTRGGDQPRRARVRQAWLGPNGVSNLTTILLVWILYVRKEKNKLPTICLLSPFFSGQVSPHSLG